MNLAAYDLPPGAHLVLDKQLYQHHGLYVGDGQVVHYAGMGDHVLDFSNSHIQKISLEAFINHSKWSIRPHKGHAFSTEKILQRAHLRLGEDDYNVLTNNCEHFVNWCIYGESESLQVQRVVKSAAKTAAYAAFGQRGLLISRLFL